MLKIIKPSEIESAIGTEIGTSEWVTINQDMIDCYPLKHKVPISVPMADSISDGLIILSIYLSI
jgi:hypothetical protein